MRIIFQDCTCITVKKSNELKRLVLNHLLSEFQLLPTLPLIAFQHRLLFTSQPLRPFKYPPQKAQRLLKPAEEVELLHGVEDALQLLLRRVPQREGDALPDLLMSA